MFESFLICRKFRPYFLDSRTVSKYRLVSSLSCLIIVKRFLRVLVNHSRETGSSLGRHPTGPISYGSLRLSSNWTRNREYGSRVKLKPNRYSYIRISPYVTYLYELKLSKESTDRNTRNVWKLFTVSWVFQAYEWKNRRFQF